MYGATSSDRFMSANISSGSNAHCWGFGNVFNQQGRMSPEIIHYDIAPSARMLASKRDFNYILRLCAFAGGASKSENHKCKAFCARQTRHPFLTCPAPSPPSARKTPQPRLLLFRCCSLGVWFCSGPSASEPSRRRWRDDGRQKGLSGMGRWRAADRSHALYRISSPQA